jgi:hypothetical protein
MNDGPMKPREPGEDGSMQGQIKTPMCAENVGNKGGGKVHSYAKTMNLNAAGPSKGAMKTDNTIDGPGAKGDWSTQINIKGNNTKHY